MGLYKIDNVSREEWERRRMRRQEIWKWAILLLEIGALAGVIVLMVLAWEWLGI